MRKPTRKVAVLGSGVMGSAIAAHFANAGIQSIVLDIVPRDLLPEEERAGLTLDDRKVRNRLADRAVKALLKTKPSPLFVPSRLSLIETGNLEDDLERLSEVDWVIEVVREEMEIKGKVLAAVAPHLADGAILSSNTSGLSLTEMAERLPEALRPRFLGTHFFNPPRYMRLLEIIPTHHTSPEVQRQVSEFSSLRLGKGIVCAKDTPNFIANRIGIHAMMATLKAMQEENLTIEEVDALTGPAIARPKTATFRLADLVGVDVVAFVAHNVAAVAADESRDIFAVPEFMKGMIGKGLLGRKSGAGFYKKVSKPEKAILTLDLETFKFREPLPPDLPELKKTAKISDTHERLRALVHGDGRAARAAWKIVAPSLSYAAMRLGEIADDAATIDEAMKLGYNWELGPFEVWDALGFRATTERLRSDGYALPEWVEALYRDGGESVYVWDGEAVTPPPAAPGTRRPAVTDPDATSLEILRRVGREVSRNDSASLIDLGDGALCLEFHSKMNVVDGRTIEMMLAAADEAEANWRTLVVANDGENFCAGANLMMLAGLAQQQDWKGVEEVVRAFQRANDRLERCGVPVVVAPHGLALGGGCEIVMAGNAIQAAAESYMGLVEVGAGLVPAGGGCLRLYKRNLERSSEGKDAYTALRQSFETIGMGKVGTSAEQAGELGFLRPGDAWSMNVTHRIADAKRLGLAMAGAGYAPPLVEQELPVMGVEGVALIGAGLVNMVEGRFISEHDRSIGRELARILAGGKVAGPGKVAEQHILDLEVEAFLRLCGEPKTQQRIEALLKTGKPLRN